MYNIKHVNLNWLFYLSERDILELVKVDPFKGAVCENGKEIYHKLNV